MCSIFVGQRCKIRAATYLLIGCGFASDSVDRVRGLGNGIYIIIRREGGDGAAIVGGVKVGHLSVTLARSLFGRSSAISELANRVMY
jgi:hypothetical protein